MVTCYFNFQFQVLAFFKGTKKLGLVHFIVDVPNDAFQTCEAAIDESMKEARDLNKQRSFNLANNVNIETWNVERGYEIGEGFVP